MKELNAFILTGVMTLSLTIDVAPAIASNSGGDTEKDGPSLQQLHNSKDRGLMLVPLPTVDQIHAPVKPVSSVKPSAGTVGTTKTVAPSATTKSVAPSATKSPISTKHIETKKTTETTKTNIKATGTNTTKTTTATTPPVTPRYSHRQTMPSKPHHHATASAQTTTKSFETTKSLETVNITPPDASKQKAALVTSAGDGTRILKAWLNKVGDQPRYKPGDKMQINVTADRDCNVMIFDFNGKGKLTQLFPNQYQQNGALKRGETVSVGGEASPFEYSASLPDGMQRSDEKLFVYAYPVDQEPPLSVAMTAISTSPFRSADYSADQYKKLVRQSKVFFSTEREFKITPKKNVTIVSSETNIAPNKVELPVVIER